MEGLAGTLTVDISIIRTRWWQLWFVIWGGKL